MNKDLLLDSYNYDLPPGAIAQAPAQPRDHSRLLQIKKETCEHRYFYELPGLLRAGDLLVLNDTRVLPARLQGTRAGGGKAELLLLHEQAPLRWQCLVRPGSRLPIGSRITLEDATAQVLDRAEGGTRIVEFQLPPGEFFLDWLHRVGTIPLPPYIQSMVDPASYQTLWAQHLGAVAAPTAGLHFTANLLEQLDLAGVHTARITLHVGLGTFRPVETSDIRTHTMHQEWLEVPQVTVAQIQATQAQGGRVIAVGTTVARALETASQGGQLIPWQGWSRLFIYPGYTWQTVEGLITNFHLPKSSLLMLVSALMGRERLLEVYAEAIMKNYRFYSFGDAMLIL